MISPPLKNYPHCIDCQLSWVHILNFGYTLGTRHASNSIFSEICYWYFGEVSQECKCLKNKGDRLCNLSPYVIGLGFEPRTDSLEGYCSIQLSYPTDPWNRLQRYTNNLNIPTPTAPFIWDYSFFIYWADFQTANLNRHLNRQRENSNYLCENNHRYNN